MRYGRGVTIGTIHEFLEGHGVFREAPAALGGVKAGSLDDIPKKFSSEPLRSPQIVSQGKVLTGVTGKDGAPMVKIPAGEFRMGSQEDDMDARDNERPVHSVHLDAFYIDQYEVTIAQYATFLQETNRGVPDFWSEEIQKLYGRRPVIGVDWNDATAYCTWAEKRLPTEAEWEKAARGTDQRLYPWGNEVPNEQQANLGEMGKYKNEYKKGYDPLTVVGSFEQGKSPYGVYDMAGNVWEWTADWYDEGYYGKSPERNPTGPTSGQYRVLRGGSWLVVPPHGRSAHRDARMPASRNSFVGFRCAASKLKTISTCRRTEEGNKAICVIKKVIATE